jgi:WD40 repeat protein
MANCLKPVGLPPMLLATSFLALALMIAITFSAVGAGMVWPQGCPAESPPARTDATVAKDNSLLAHEPATAKKDLYGDPLPPGAIARLGTMRLRHRNEVRCVAWSPDGKFLASGSWHDGVRLWNGSTGQLVRELSVGGNSTHGVAFSPDGGKLAAVGDEGMVWQWDVNTGKKLFEKNAHKGRVHSIAYSSDGRSFASAGEDGRVCVCDSESGTERWAFAAEGNNFHHPVAISPDNRLLASAPGGKIFLWDLKSGRRLRIIDTGPRRETISLGFLDKETLVTAGSRYQVEKVRDKQVTRYVGETQIWNARTGTLVRELKAEGNDGPGNMALSPDGKVIAISHRSRLRLWSLADGKPIREITGFTNKRGDDSQGLAFSPDGKRLAGKIGDISVRCWEVATGRPTLEYSDAHTHWMCTTAFTTDGHQVVTGSFDGTVRLWDARKAQLIRSHVVVTGEDWPRELQTVLLVSTSPDGKIVGAATEANSARALSADVPGTKCLVKFWDEASGKELSAFSFSDRVTALAFSGDAKIVAAATWAMPDPFFGRKARGMVDFAIHLCNPRTGRVEKKLLGHKGAIHALVFPPRQKKLISIAEDGTVRFWDLDTGKQEAQISFPARRITMDIAVSPEGNLFAYLDRESGMIVVKELPTGREIVTFQLKDVDEGLGFILHPKLAFSANGRRLATVSFLTKGAAGRPPCLVHLWEVLTGRELARYGPAEAISVMCLAFSHDGTELVSGMSNGTAYVWDLVAARPGVKRFEAAQLERLWHDLGDKDAVLAYKAMWLLAAAPDQAVPFLGKHLHPAASADPKRVARLLTDLASDRFGIRQKATTELEQLAEFAEPALHKALQSAPDEEMRRRVALILKKLDGPIASANTVRGIRALEVLERAATANARRLLQELADGAPEARLSQHARRVVARRAK